jgi:hypothetical protein
MHTTPPRPQRPSPPPKAPSRSLIPGIKLHDYLKQSSNIFNGLVLIAPLFLLYQAGIILQLSVSDSGAFSLNGADWFTSHILRLLNGSLGLYTVFVGLTMVCFGGILKLLGQRNKLQPAIFAPVIAESVIYALLFGTTIHFITGLPGMLAAVGVLSGAAAFVSPAGIGMKVFHALGAGVNEELLFRLGMMGGPLALGRLAKLSKVALTGIALILSSLAFSGFHYIGPFGDPFTFNSFTFRFLAGVLLGGIYLSRGLAVAVYTHAIYDLYFFLCVQD